MEVYLRTYNVVDSRLHCKIASNIYGDNHCSVQVENTVLHFSDRYNYPRVLSVKADNKLQSLNNILYVGTSNKQMEELIEFIKTLKYMSRKDHVMRYLSGMFTLFYLPHKNDCVYNSSRILNYLFKDLPVFCGTPERFYNTIKQHGIKQYN